MFIGQQTVKVGLKAHDTCSFDVQTLLMQQGTLPTSREPARFLVTFNVAFEFMLLRGKLLELLLQPRQFLGFRAMLFSLGNIVFSLAQLAGRVLALTELLLQLAAFLLVLLAFGAAFKQPGL